MRKFFIILIVFLLIFIGGIYFFLFKIENHLASFGYQPKQRIISPQKIIWKDLSHPTRSIQSLTLHLWSFPPKINIDGMTITSLPSSSESTKVSSTSKLPELQIEIDNLSVNVENFPPVHDLSGSLFPEFNLSNQNISIQKREESWEISGSIPFEHEHFSTTIQFSLQGEDMEATMLNPQISHSLLKKKYTLPDIPWKGTVEKEHITLNSQWDNSEINISLQPNFSDVKASSLSFSSRLAFSDVVDWFEIKKQLRPKEFSVQGDLLLTLQWKKNALQNISFDAKDLQVFGDVFQAQQLRQAGISYRPIHANRARLLGVSSPDWISYSKLGWLKEAVIAAEDSQFQAHDGINRQGIQEALSSSKLENFSSGGSSITQQLAKNIFLHNEKTLERKLLELVYAISMEKQLSKEAILALYLNAIEFGPNIYGAKQASSYYFMKSPQNLTIREAAFLAAILPNPLQGNEKAQKGKIPNYKINLIIENMYAGKNISKNQMNSEKLEQLHLLMPRSSSN